eukprot:TRINITY_DN6095_c0_g1_i9.p1 TRINITY_DN6095_c0_g1~~TRINITY_DN6095_c0_g1_i9.p1  ORF type:complete len:221 (-),score=15.89 TRINITY_DN6095_c0_g1_i9:105-767(-)
MASFALALFGYYGTNKWFMIGGISLLFMLFIIMLCHLAYTASELIVTLDICEQVYEILHNNKLPYKSEGLAYYLSPFTYESKGRILGMIFNTTESYDYFVQALNGETELTSAGKTVQTYDEFLQLVEESTISETLISKYSAPFQMLKEIVEMLFDMRYYRHLSKSAQDIEEPLCNKAVNHYPHAFFGVVVMLIGNLITVVSLLRMLTVKNKMNSRAGYKM